MTEQTDDWEPARVRHVACSSRQAVVTLGDHCRPQEPLHTVLAAAKATVRAHALQSVEGARQGEKT